MFKKSEPDSVRQVPESQDTTFGTERNASAMRVKETATIGPSIRIRGDLAGDEDLLVQGQVEGTITLEQNLVTIGKEGKVNATVNARVIIVEGEVDGDLNGEEQVTLKKSAGVRGNIVSPRVSLEDGARFKGSIDMEGEASKKSGANPKSNKVTEIKSPSASSDEAAKSPRGKSEEQQLFKP
ncbi:MAG: polymer-forming cytoskeletal protein [Gammaproteobacteria bacterium]|nr:polymer-forming cytoskeletal protein [Gammaproteobacteria bacterium]